MTTVADMVEQVVAELHGTQREELNELSAAVTAAATSVSLSYDIAGAVRGAYLAVDDEVMYVWSSTGQVASVRRGMLGTTAAAHDSGALVTVNPAWPRGIVKRAITEEIRSWPGSLFGVTSEELTVSTTSQTTKTTLSADSRDFLHVLDVRELRDSTGGVGTRDSWPRIRHFEVVHGLTSAGSVDLQITQQVRGSTVWVAYARAFDLTDLTDAVDIVTDIGVPDSAIDIVRMGAAMRLIPQREAMRARTDTQGQPRDAAEVQPGQNSQTAMLYKSLRDQRIAEEAVRLRTKWPTIGG